MLVIAASIVAARKLAHGDGRPSLALESAIADGNHDYRTNQGEDRQQMAERAHRCLKSTWTEMILEK